VSEGGDFIGKFSNISVFRVHESFFNFHGHFLVSERGSKVAVLVSLSSHFYADISGVFFRALFTSLMRVMVSIEGFVKVVKGLLEFFFLEKSFGDTNLSVDNAPVRRSEKFKSDFKTSVEGVHSFIKMLEVIMRRSDLVIGGGNMLIVFAMSFNMNF